MSKRVFDLVFSLVGLIALLPLFLIVALLIKLDSPGDVFFRQTRVGRNLRPFRIHKFRTMAANGHDGPSVTMRNDPRVTRVGLFLRKYKIDELPQIIDVILGDMSLVGPRPEVPEYVRAYSDEDRDIIFSIKPGITDRASIVFRNECDLLEDGFTAEQFYLDEVLPVKIKLYREYVLNRSFWVDLIIIRDTVWAILCRSVG